jgi:2'-5' RNA ligase
MAREPEATGVSLWLMPEGAPREELQALVLRLAALQPAPAFAPHVTLLAGVQLDEGESLMRAEVLARALSPLGVRFSGPGGFDEYFRALFLRVEPTVELVGANARARAAFERHGDPAFFPHLSLWYGRPAAAERARLSAAIGPVIDGFEARRLSLVRTRGRVEDWQPLAVFGLGSGRRL